MVSAGEFVRITAGPYTGMTGIVALVLSRQLIDVVMTATGQTMTFRLADLKPERRASEILLRLRERAVRERVATR